MSPLFSIPEILSGVMTVGKKGIQMYRFKGLGEMDAKELFETTMNPAKRKLLRIELTDAVEAEEMFVRLMGDEVEPRRQFIEDNALNVRNLDVEKEIDKCGYARSGDHRCHLAPPSTGACHSPCSKRAGSLLQ